MIYADKHILYHIFNVSGTLKDKHLSILSASEFVFPYTPLNPRRTNPQICLAIIITAEHNHSYALITQTFFFLEECQNLIIDFHESAAFRPSLCCFKLEATKREQCVMQRKLKRACFAFDRPLTLSSGAMRTSPQSRLEGHVERCKFRQDHRESCKA